MRYQCNARRRPIPVVKICLCLTFATLFTGFGIFPAHADTPFWISFESDEPSPFFEFTPEDRGGSYGMTQDIDTETTPSLFGAQSANLSDPWERVSLPIGMTEGLVQVWFYDGNYGNGTPGTQTLANAIRLGSDEVDPYRDAGWPRYFLTVDLKGEYTGHGRSGFLEYYTVARNDVPGDGMGVDFAYPAASTHDDFYRTTDTWHLVAFDIDGGQTSVAIDGEMADLVETRPLTKLELLCRSGWYQTRPGEAKIMQWDGIAVSPKIHSTDFSATPSWMSFTSGSALDFATTLTEPAVPFGVIPGSAQLARFASQGQQMECCWNVEQGAIEIWFWDNIADEGGNPDNGGIDIIVYDSDTPSSYTRMRTYESVMGSATTKWYLVSPQSSAAMGSSYNLSRRQGWNKLVFHKTPSALFVSLNGQLVKDESYRWDDPPLNMTLQIASRSGSSYADGFPLWLGRIVVAGEAPEGPTSASAQHWNRY